MYKQHQRSKVITIKTNYIPLFISQYHRKVVTLNKQDSLGKQEISRDQTQMVLAAHLVRTNRDVSCRS